MSTRLHEYHNSFHGDTYDACARCKGKCEQYKISTLIPGEKEYMARVLGLPLQELENKYLDRLDTGCGFVEVLKMKNGHGCPFLDAEFHCTAMPAKPVLCDMYPVVFEVEGARVKFSIDQHDCPMVHWPEYAACVQNFAINGIKAVRKLRAPVRWWRMVELYDQFDFDYAAIEKTLRGSTNYETYWLEDVLAFACNGYERRARLQGLSLLGDRVKESLHAGLKKIENTAAHADSFMRALARSYRHLMAQHAAEILRPIGAARRDKDLLNRNPAKQYRLLVAETKVIVDRIQNDAQSFQCRLRDVALHSRSSLKGKCEPSRVIEEISPVFGVGMNRRPAEALEAREVMSPRGRDATEGYALLSRCFAPDEIDSYVNVVQLLEQSRGNAGNAGHGDRGLWYRWVMAVLRNSGGRLVAAGDGAVIANRDTNVFYFSHVATAASLRSKGIGTLVSGYLVQAANDHLPEALQVLGRCKWGGGSPGTALLRHELSEIEFPDSTDLGIASMRRLTYHGRAGRAALWPLRYAQPDTDYRLDHFDPARWNSVPMFLSYRCFGGRPSVPAALDAGQLLFDFFADAARASVADGIESDRAYLLKHRDPRCRLVPFPTDPAAIGLFVKRTGLQAHLLKTYYAGHRYTKDRLRYLDLI